MATIQRSLLIEAPVHHSFAFWRDPGRFHGFLVDVLQAARRITGDGPSFHEEQLDVRLLEQVDNRLLRWRYDAASNREGVLTFASLEGNATWFTFTLELEPSPGARDTAQHLTALARAIDRGLRNSREAIESGPVTRPSRVEEGVSSGPRTS